MNERIKELKSQCWDERQYGPPWFNSDKFAELIVRECAGVTLDYKNHDHYTGWCDHAEEILKHFGVEE
jgi:hypothetical protein